MKRIRRVYETGPRPGPGKLAENYVVETPPAESPLGRFLFPSGVKGDFGQIVQLKITYGDGATCTYTVEDAE